MIRGVFKIGGENQEVIVRGNELLFSDLSSGMVTTVEGLKLSYKGSIKEFPDLKDDEEWKKKVIERFKEKIKTFKKEIEKIQYVKSELIKQGYKPLYYQCAGFRPKKF